MASLDKDGPQYPAHGGATIFGDPTLCGEALGSQGGMATSDPARNVAQGGTSRLATCAPTRPLSDFVTCGTIPLRKKEKKNRAGCGAAAQTQAPMAVFSATPPVASGSNASSMEITPAASAAVCLAQENPSLSLVASPAMGDGGAGQSPSLDLEELLKRSSFHGSSGKGDMALDSLQESTVPFASASFSSVGEATSGLSGVSTGRKWRKTKDKGWADAASRYQKKKAKRDTSVAASFAQAKKDDLLGIVLVRDNSLQTFTRAEMARVKTELGRQVNAVIDAGERLIPRFTDCGMRNSRFTLSCANRESFMWLKTTLDNLEVGKGDGLLRLRLATPDEVPKLIRAEVFL